jgi:hypothetical protein
LGVADIPRIKHIQKDAKSSLKRNSELFDRKTFGGKIHETHPVGHRSFLYAIQKLV